MRRDLDVNKLYEVCMHFEEYASTLDSIAENLNNDLGNLFVDEIGEGENIHKEALRSRLYDMLKSVQENSSMLLDIGKLIRQKVTLYEEWSNEENIKVFSS